MPGFRESRVRDDRWMQSISWVRWMGLHGNKVKIDQNSQSPLQDRYVGPGAHQLGGQKPLMWSSIVSSKANHPGSHAGSAEDAA